MTLSAAPFRNDVAEGPPGGAAYWMTTSDNVRIRIGCWTPENAKGTVLLFPGRTEYIEKYGRAAVELSQRGFATLAIDWRGQGLADRLLDNPLIGHVDLFTDFQKDVDAMMRGARELDLPQPYFLLAHSMGGCIGLRAMMEGLPVQAAVFSGPMWGIQMAPTSRPVAWALSHGSGWLGQGHRPTPGTGLDPYVLMEPFENNMLTTDADMHDYMVRQLKAYPDFSLGPPSLIWLREALTETRHLARRPAPRIPCYTVVGGNERIVDVDRIRQRMADWPGGILDIVDTAEHEVLMETPEIRNRVFDKISGLFSGHNPESATAHRA